MSGKYNCLDRQTDEIIYFGDENYCPPISVIMPVYNAEKYLKESVESVLRPTFSDFELILVNDGSKDNSLNLCIEYASKDNRVRVVNKSNCGASSARNKGLQLAKGRYISFIDSDDYIDEDFLEESYYCLETKAVDIFVSGIKMETFDREKIIEETIYKLGKPSQEYTTKGILEDWGRFFAPGCICAPYCKLYRKDILLSNNIEFDETMNRQEDSYFNLQIFEATSKIWFSDKVYYHYCRQNTDSLFNTFQKNIYECHAKVFYKLDELMERFYVNNNIIKNSYFPSLLNGLIEHYWSYDKTTDTEKRIYIEKFANDALLKKYGIRNIKGIKNKLFYSLLKMRLYTFILFIFKKRYKKG